MNTTAKLNERLAFTEPGVWAPMENYRQFIGVGIVVDTSPPTEVTVELHKATDVGGSDDTVIKPAVTGDTEVSVQAYTSELGETAEGIPFTHVTAIVTGGGSPPAGTNGVVIRGDGRFNP